MPRPMSAQTRNEARMKEQAGRQITKVSDPVEKIRLLCLQRGTSGILGLGRLFRRMDDNGSGDLTQDEFRKGLQEIGMEEYMTEEDMEQLFKDFDRDGSGAVNYEEFIRSIRPKLSQSRINLIDMAFKKLDKSGDGQVTMEDLQGSFSVRNHPDYLNGSMTEKQLLTKFLNNFEEGGILDGVITKDEFTDYYTGVSASIDQDGYFDLMMRTCWKL